MSIWWIILIFLIIATALFIILFILWPDIVRPTIPAGSINNISSFNESCSLTQPCQPDLVCEINQQTGVGICKQPLNGPCNNLDDCNLSGPNGATICQINSNVAGTIGTCQRTEVGGINQPCPCEQGLECVETADGNRCKLTPGSECTFNDECSSGVCDGVTFSCTFGRALGETCTTGACAPGLVCSLGFCQSIGLTSGQADAYCLPNQPAPPSSAPAPGCINGLSCIGNTCTPAVNRLGATCDEQEFCAPPLNCILQENNTVGQCYFSAQVNSCVQDTCIANFTCVEETCLAHEMQACRINNNCLNDQCNGPAQLFTWLGNDSWSNLGNLPANELAVQLVSYYQSETVIYLYIANENGIYRNNYNRQNNSLANWQLIIEGSLMRMANNEVVEQTIKSRTLTVDSNNRLFICYENLSPSANWDGLYYVDILQDGSGSLVAFNTLPDELEGQQFTSVENGSALIINAVSISINQDVLISGFTSANTQALVYRKLNMQLTYQEVVVGSQAQFIVPNNDFPPADNYAYVNATETSLLFKGQAEGANYPQPLPGSAAPVRTYRIINYSIYSDEFTSALNGPIWLLAEISSGGSGYSLFVIENSAQYSYAGYFDALTRVTALPRNNNAGAATSYQHGIIQAGKTCN